MALTIKPLRFSMSVWPMKRSSLAVLPLRYSRLSGSVFEAWLRLSRESTRRFHSALQNAGGVQSIGGPRKRKASLRRPSHSVHRGAHFWVSRSARYNRLYRIANFSSNERYKIYELKPSTGQLNFNPTCRTIQTDWACEHQPFSSSDW